MTPNVAGGKSAEPDTSGLHESVGWAREALAVAGSRGARIRELAQEAGLTDSMLSDDRTRVPSAQVFRLWELAEHATGDPCLGLATAHRCHLVDGIELMGYLFRTAPTVRDALRTCCEYSYMISTNWSLRAEADDGAEVTYSYRGMVDGGRGEELYHQVSIARCCSAVRAVTGRPVVPSHVGFAQAAPAAHRKFAEALGTRRIDFGTTVTTITFRAQDVGLPVIGADPGLAGLLRQYAALLPAPSPVSWLERFRRHVAEALRVGTPSLDVLAGRMSVSRRTLQRQLAEQGTNWRTELDAARQRIAMRASQSGAVDVVQLGRQLGYDDPGSVRRIIRRLQDSDGRVKTRQRAHMVSPGTGRSPVGLDGLAGWRRRVSRHRHDPGSSAEPD